MSNIERIQEIKKRLEELPTGYLSYKTINQKQQPYLQRTENGRTKSYFIKLSERESVLAAIEERRTLEEELALLQSYSTRIVSILLNNPYLDRRACIGCQDFRRIMEKGGFYVDKTEFFYEWWNSATNISIITRPRRFGKTLMLSAVENFFSLSGRGEKNIFEKLQVWKHAGMRMEYASHPVIFLSFANVKGIDFRLSLSSICYNMYNLFMENRDICEKDLLSAHEKLQFQNCIDALNNNDYEACVKSVNLLSQLLYMAYQKPVIILLDEYDTPSIESIHYGYYDEMIAFLRQFFNQSFKNNPYYSKVLITGITRIAKESLFSDLNNAKLYSMANDTYAQYFGFTQEEVLNILDCQDIQEKELVKSMYDGHTIGHMTDIYNPWSITNYMADRIPALYWANSGGTKLLSDIFSKGKDSLRLDLETLINGGSIHKTIDETIIFEDLFTDENSVWSLLFSAGYLKATNLVVDKYVTADFSLTNVESLCSMENFIKRWFGRANYYTDFAKSLLQGDLEAMNYYFAEVVADMISFFDTGSRNQESAGTTSSLRAPESFYHGLVLGMIVDMRDRYRITSNRESGFGRYDVMLTPVEPNLDGIILEFKVMNPKKESSLEETAMSALQQIKDKNYASELIANGVQPDKIRNYGFAFCGKEVLIL